MTSKYVCAVVCLLCSAVARLDAKGLADQNLEVDLDGDGRAEIIVLQVSPHGEYGTFKIKVGDDSFAGQYFAYEGDKPSISTVRLNSTSPAKQLMINVNEPVDCEYQFLSYDGRSLALLGSLNSKNCVNEPKVTGDGEVTLLQWEGFWSSTRRFHLAGNPPRLQPRLQRFYDVNKEGVAATRLSLHAMDSDALVGYVGLRQRVSIRRFDTKTGLYEVVVNDGTSGWTEVTSDLIDGLDWAG